MYACLEAAHFLCISTVGVNVWKCPGSRHWHAVGLVWLALAGLLRVSVGNLMIDKKSNISGSVQWYIKFTH